MTVRNVALGDLRGRTIEDVLTGVAAREEILIVTLPGGQSVGIRSMPVLEPLPLFEGTIAEGWKDPIYDYSN